MFGTQLNFFDQLLLRNQEVDRLIEAIRLDIYNLKYLKLQTIACMDFSGQNLAEVQLLFTQAFDIYHDIVMKLLEASSGSTKENKYKLGVWLTNHIDTPPTDIKDPLDLRAGILSQASRTRHIFDYSSSMKAHLGPLSESLALTLQTIALYIK